MASDRKIVANRRNATASTGPRTHHGKARASRNARKHGFTVPIVQTEDGLNQVERLARVIAGQNASAARLEMARLGAEAELELLRVRNHKVTLINAKLALPAQEEPTHLEDIELEWEVTDFLELVPKLSLLDRYERRAYAQRNKALRKLAHL
jgi:hypothetical protein